MITAAFLSTHSDSTDRLRAVFARHVTVLDLDAEVSTAAALGNMPLDIIVMDATHLTEGVIGALSNAQALHADSVTVCAATEDVAERARVDDLLSPDFWVILPASDVQLVTQVEMILAFVNAGGNRALVPSVVTTQMAPAKSALARSGNGHLSHPEGTLYRIMGRMTGSGDSDTLFAAYCDAVHEITKCVSYCLLWQDAGTREFAPVQTEGLPPVIHNICRLSPTDPLPSWLQRTRGIVVRDALLGDAERAGVLRELDMCGGVLAVPLLCQASLRGIMAVGPKAIGAPYTSQEAEALFMLSTSAAAAARQTELHQELEARNNYIAQVLSTMESGIITLGLDATICVCNPYAAAVLRLKPEEVLGRDLRVLPTPLGDYLYAGLTYGEERTREEVSLFGGEVALRISSQRLIESRGGLIGSMMLLEDMTAEHALAAERRRAERNDVISQIVARFAHELKNPLATINTFAELLPTRDDDPEFREFWSLHVKRDVRRLDDLVAKLVSLSDSPRSSRELVEVRDLVRLAVARVELLDEDAPSHIVSKLNGSLPQVHVDADVMATAFSHLFRYGLGHEHNEVTIDAELQEGPAGEQPIGIFIRARGDAPSDGEPGRILDPSHVIDHPDIDLGPSASQRLIESQGGALEAYYEGGDIVFRVSLLPADTADTDDAEEE